ncbi:putative metalloprotease CJM1_0395 family protein [Aliikangiella sp. IMCC44653]
MIITAPPISIPVSTANPPTEAVAAEAARKVPVPEAKPTVENPSLRQAADPQEPSKSNSAQTNDKVDPEAEKESNNSQGDPNNSQEERAQAQQQQEVEALKRTDREVRAHEAAHASAGGSLAGAPQLSFVTGPDGKRYAVSGEVSIDTSKVANNPQATIDKMEQVRRAALAPASPSSQDLKVAAIASQIANQAKVELQAERNQPNSSRSSTEADDTKQTNLRVKDPLSAIRQSLALNQRIADSGALSDAESQANIRTII